MKRVTILFSMAIAATVMLFTSYGCAEQQKEKKDQEKVAIDEQAVATEEPPIAVDTPRQSQSTAIIYLDNSVSMQGYSVHNVYTDVLTNLVHYKGKANTRVLLCCDKYKEFSGDLIDGVKGGKIKYGSSSLLHADLKEMAQNVTDNNIQFLVTDGILSGTAEDIKKNRKWTLDHAEDLMREIEDVFDDSNDISVSIYQYESPFKGTYYCYTNIDYKDIDTNRYFYVIVLGKMQAIEDFRKECETNDKLKTSKQYNIIGQLPLSGNLIVKYAKLIKNEWVYDISKIKNSKESKDSLIITLPVKDFKPMLNGKSIEDLAASMIVKAGNHTIAPEDIKYDEGNDYFSIKVPTNLCGKKGCKVCITIPFNIPSWVTLSSCLDDMYMKEKGRADNKTLLFDKLVNGIALGKLGKNGSLYEDSVFIRRTE